MFACVASVLMLASVVPVSVLGAASYSDELQGAYDYAYGIGITTQSTIDNANMYGSLIRSHMAKMIVNYAKEVKGLTPDTSLACNFTDIANETEELEGYITESCQLGLMGVDINAFNPNGVVTRAQFGTILSRVLYGDTYNGGNPYYVDHLNALKDAGIMNNISAPNAPEIRGYVMLMMQRADEGTVPEICTTPENTLSCTLWLDSCPDECTKTEAAKDGTLDVSLLSSDGWDVPYGISSLPVATYKFTADKDVRLDSVVVKRFGYFTSTNIPSAALFINGWRVSKVASFSSSSDEATMTITNGYEIKAWETVNIAVHVALLNNSNTDQFYVKLLSVDSTAENVDLASNLTSDTFKIVTTATPYLTFDDGSTSENPKAGETSADLFEFTIDNPSANDQDINLTSITFKENGGTIDEADELENFKLLVDGSTVATADKITGKYVIFNLEDGYLIKEWKTPTFTVQADVLWESANDTIMFTLDNAMDIVAIGDKYDKPARIAITTNAMDTVTVSAGKITLTRINPPSTDLLGNKKDQFLGALTITNNAWESLKLQTLKLNLTGTATPALDTVKIRLWSTTASPVELTASWNTGRAETSLEKSIGSKLTVYVYADTIDTGMDARTLRMSLNGVNANTSNFLIEETANDTDVTDIAPTSLTWSNMLGKDASLTLTNVILGDKTVSEWTESVEALKFKIKAGAAYGTKLKKFTFASAGVDSDTVTMAKLYKGTTEIPATVNNGTIVIDEDQTIAAGVTQEFTLKLDIANNPEVTGFAYYLSWAMIEAEDLSVDKDTVTITGRVTGRTITVTEVWTLQAAYESTVTNNKYNKNILAGETETVAEYSLYSKYEVINIWKAVVTFAGDTDIDNSVLDVKLFYNGNEVASDPTWDSTGQIATFDDLDFDTIKDTKTPLLVKVISKQINEDGGETVTASYVTSIVLDTMKWKDSGDDITVSTTSDNAKTFDIVPVKITPSVATIGASNTNIVITAEENSNTKTDGTEAKATLSGMTFTVEGSNSSLYKIYLKDATNSTLGNVIVTADWDYEIGAIATELSNGPTTFYITTSLTGSSTNTYFDVSLKSIKYYTNVTWTLLDAQFGAAKALLHR